MCIIFIYVVENPKSPYRYIIGANRDEFLDRPAEKAAQWHDVPGCEHVFAGRDLKAGGTWLGLRAQVLKLPKEQALSGATPKAAECKVPLRLGMITNHREKKDPNVHRPSRGQMLVNFLGNKNRSSPKEFGERLLPESGQFDGFNLIIGDVKDLYYISNRSQQKEPLKLSPGVHGLSNGLLDDSWPKNVKGKAAFKDAVETHLNFGGADGITGEGILIDSIFQIMENDTTESDLSLYPGVFDHGVEKALSSIFVQPFKQQGKGASLYGTRSTAVILVRKNGTIAFSEKHVLDGSGKLATTRHNLHFSNSLSSSTPAR